MIKLTPYTDRERKEIADNIRAFAEQETYESCFLDHDTDEVLVSSVTPSRCQRQVLALMADNIEHKVHEQGTSIIKLYGASG